MNQLGIRIGTVGVIVATTFLAPNARAEGPKASASKAPPAPVAKPAGMLVPGILMLLAGAGTLAGAAVVGATCKNASDGCSGQTGALVGFSLTSAALIGGGLVTLLVDRAAPPVKAETTWVPKVALGPTGGSLRWSF